MRLLPCAALLVLWGCGETIFIDPDGPRKAELVLTNAERLLVEGDPRTYLFLRVKTRGRLDDVRFSVVGPAGQLQLPEDGRDLVPCADGSTCLSYTLGLGWPAELDQVVLEAPEIGHRAVRDLAVFDLGGYAFSGSAGAGNTLVEGQLLDPIRSHFIQTELLEDGRRVQLFPRSFEAWTTSGPCASLPLGSDSGWAPMTSVPFRMPARYSAEPEALACVAVRPSRPADGAAIAAETVAASALVERFTHLYAPPVERSPLVYQLIFDLEMPSEARCTAAKDLVEAAVRDTATQIAADQDLGAEVLGLPPLDLAVTNGVPCRQSNDRRLFGSAVTNVIVGEIRERFGADRPVRVVLIYATNLNLPLPDNLRQELAGLPSFFPEDLRAFTIFISPELPAQGAQADQRFDWTSTQEPSFRGNIASTMALVWPFFTMIHRADTFVPLANAGALSDLVAYRGCSGDQPVTLEGTPYPSGGGANPPLLLGPLGPGYRVALTPQILVPRSQYNPVTVRVVWEGCRGLCDRPAPGSLQGTPWSRSDTCL